EIAAQMRDDARRLAEIEAILHELDEPRPRAFEAVVREVPPVRVATRRARVADLDAGAEALFEAVEADALAARARVPGPPLLLYHDRDYRETGADIHACVRVRTTARHAGSVTS